jgi:penicillin-binding protein 1A
MKKQKHPHSIIFRALLWTLVVLLAILIVRLTQKIVQNLPDIHTLEEYQPSLITQLYDTDGKPFYDFFVERRTLVPLNEIPVDLQNATIAIEDNHFFRHWGIDISGIARAILSNLKAGHIVEGGSTITQQLAKVLFLTPEKKLIRKIKELIIAVQLEREYSKEEVLWLYLNQIYFGHGAYGVQAAAQLYFGKDVQDLTLDECAMLAGLPRSPGRYSPFINRRRAYWRRATVLKRMVDLGFITSREAFECQKELLPEEAHPIRSKLAPYFVEYIRQYLERNYGANALYRGGLQVYTTLNSRLQETAEKVYSEHLESFDERRKKEVLKEIADEYKIEISTPLPDDIQEMLPPPAQGAMVVIDPRTGQIRAMIGGRDFSQSQFNRATQAHRQSGSAFKPFVYSAALDNGLTLSTLIDDSPIAYYNDGVDWRLLARTTDLSDVPDDFIGRLDPEQLWIPQNYSREFHGRTMLIDALVYSRNVCTVKILDRIRPVTAVYYAQQMGITSPLEKTLSLALGSFEVTPLEITSAFATLANSGVRIKPYAIKRIEDFTGNVLEEHFPEAKMVMSEQLAYLVTYALQKVAEEGTGSATAVFARPRAGKTGTTNEFTDAWFIGYIPNLVCGTWVGYDDCQTLGDKKTGGGVAAPIWGDFMNRILATEPVQDFTVPPDIVFCRVDPETGLLALENSADARLLPFIKGTEPTRYAFTLSGEPEDIIK